MTQGRQETREEEVARVRSYLASQSMRRTPAQIVDALREANQQFLEATAAIPDALFQISPKEGEWSAAEVLLHVRTIAAFETMSILSVLERGKQPPDAQEGFKGVPPVLDMSRTRLLADLQSFREQLIAAALAADPQAHLDITWSEAEYGPMHWREWLLFARVHVLDHARQMQAINAALQERTAE